ncbi:S24/S26 family peptidase [Kineococcus endophyticus]|uniref:S24/S26 family peptidase n=1 Tax=Kineococcus endophyticus TaxID=1181883 RepID=A0ABV3P3U8_9ACTN
MVVVPVAPRASARRTLRPVGRALLTTVQVGLLLFATTLVCAHLVTGLTLHAVLSDSMKPSFAAGDHLVTVERDALSLRAGQVPLLTFADGTTRAHRILQVLPERGIVRVLTRGDANTATDLWTSIDAEAPVPVVLATAPAVPAPVTAAVAALHANPLPAALAIGLGGLGLTAWAVRRQYVRLRDCTCERCRDRHAPQHLDPALHTEEIR